MGTSDRLTAHASVVIYDTTLRDGAQREGLAFSLEDKINIAHRLDQLGIPFIEGGWPGANPKDNLFFEHLKQQPLQQAALVAFCSTRRPHKQAQDDAVLATVLAAETRWITLFGKSWDLQVTQGLHTSLDENLAMIADSVAFLVSQGRQVIYDAEHWFDGYQANPQYALETLRVARAAGAQWLVLCDTNGGTLPLEIAAGVQAVQQYFQLELNQPDVPLGVHTHNDGGMAVANAVIAVQSGVRMVQGTINGYGERCGNANLCSIIPTLQLKLQRPCLPENCLTDLTPLSRLISEVANLSPDEHAPFVGLSAFAHKGGIHVSAVQRNPLTYEHIDPAAVGNCRRIVISDQAGVSNVIEKALNMGFQLNKQDPTTRQILQRIKDLESHGYQFEAAEASFELLIYEAVQQRPVFFTLKSFDVHCAGQHQGTTGLLSSNALATVKVDVNGQEMLTAAEGNGPVSALDTALRKALVNFYPIISEFQLADYKVRILDGINGTAARTRVLVESSNGQVRWSTVGVSVNIIEASYQAVAQGMEYGLLQYWKQIECSEGNALESFKNDAGSSGISQVTLQV